MVRIKGGFYLAVLPKDLRCDVRYALITLLIVISRREVESRLSQRLKFPGPPNPSWFERHRVWVYHMQAKFNLQSSEQSRARDQTKTDRQENGFTDVELWRALRI
jgi:hypothetical protein